MRRLAVVVASAALLGLLLLTLWLTTLHETGRSLSPLSFDGEAAAQHEDGLPSAPLRAPDSHNAFHT